MFKLNRHVDSRLFKGTSGRCASALYEVSVWVDIELNPEDTTGVRRKQEVSSRWLTESLPKSVRVL
ncbi:hypothetical protein FOIG_04749 [Fusarium odoratissimum NRRL 54006]|uniref:Uncharacterized protein n=2 Tax=Fusarium oxysporum species complex TaxID=171631 RepID=X0K704_FUSO5|nr:uncharacterized protein FOIG_04749 [Fusarium odoratissimum NRRL 54006]EXM04537.1 hypothetical protein FOIG_04749 [Fusarium odoratissimum NRRL 54006]TXB99191.1 hypothetical protein FocTR4_00012471 [Fusarium oxysporum f. sp. cubense]